MPIRHQLELYRFGSIHARKLLSGNPLALTQGACFLNTPPPIISVRKFVDEFHLISAINCLRFDICIAVTVLKYGLARNRLVPYLSFSLPWLLRPSA